MSDIGVAVIKFTTFLHYEEIKKQTYFCCEVKNTKKK